MTDEEIQKWTRLAYLRFYYRPKYMARAASRLKSYDELKRSAETAIKMLTEPVDRDDAGMEVLA
jgi:hypothetical protein